MTDSATTQPDPSETSAAPEVVVPVDAPTAATEPAAAEPAAALSDEGTGGQSISSPATEPAATEPAATEQQSTWTLSEVLHLIVDKLAWFTEDEVVKAHEAISSAKLP